MRANANRKEKTLTYFCMNIVKAIFLKVVIIFSQCESGLLTTHMDLHSLKSI